MASTDDSERMVEIVTALAVVGEVLAGLLVKLASATPAEIPVTTTRPSRERLTSCAAKRKPAGC
jgi:hypothetical protein